MNNKTPARSNVVVLKQILNLIPRGMINRHALETGVEGKARTFSVLSHRKRGPKHHMNFLAGA